MKWSTALGTLALPLALGLAWAALRSPPGVAPFAAPALQGCQSGRAVTDHVDWRPATGDADLVSSGLLRLQVCGSGTLKFTASGTPAQGQDATLIVALGGRPLLETPVRQARTYTLRVSGPGWLSLAFPNDLYRPPEDRNLFLRGLTFRPD